MESNIENDPVVNVTIIESDGCLTKSYKLQDNILVSNQVLTLKNGCAMTLTASVSTVAGYIGTMKPNQCFMYGQFKNTDKELSYRVVMKHEKQPGTVTRTSEDTCFPVGEPGFLLIDYDPKFDAIPQIKVSDSADLIRILDEVCPGLAKAARIEKPSASSGICRKDTGETFQTKGGLRFLIAVDDVSKIPEIGSALFKRLVLAGYGSVWPGETGVGYIRTALVHK
jgi:hypothetical protein